MRRRYRDKIKKNFAELVINIEPDVLAEFLVSKRTLERKEVKQIFADRADYKHNNRLIIFQILKKNDTAYHQFVEGLELFGLQHLFSNSGNGRRIQVFQEASNEFSDEESLSLSLFNINDSVTIPDTPKSVFQSVRKPLVIGVKMAKVFPKNNFNEMYDTKSDKRGQVLIINNRYFKQYHEERRGSEYDIQSLKDLFEQMYMKVQIYEDLIKSEMEEAIQKFAKFESDKISDICVVCIMSHGEERNKELVVLDKDNNGLKASWIEDQFSNVNCSLFSGKPKVILYQFCRGTMYDYATTKLNSHNHNNNEEVDNSTEQKGLIDTDMYQHDHESSVEFDSGPIFKVERRTEDILVAYPTQQGHRAHRDRDFGSWYIQLICEVFMERAHNTHIIGMLNEVDRRLRLFSSPDYTMQTSGYKSSGFNKYLFFNPGIYLDASGSVQKFN